MSNDKSLAATKNSRLKQQHDMSTIYQPTCYHHHHHHHVSSMKHEEMEISNYY